MTNWTVETVQALAKDIQRYINEGFMSVGGRPWASEAASALTWALERIDTLSRLDREAATHVETIICMRTHFTGDSPYVGWKGLGLALREHLDRIEAERDAANARAEKLLDELECAHATIADAEHDTRWNEDSDYTPREETGRYRRQKIIDEVKAALKTQEASK